MDDIQQELNVKFLSSKFYLIFRFSSISLLTKYSGKKKTPEKNNANAWEALLNHFKNNVKKLNDNKITYFENDESFASCIYLDWFSVAFKYICLWQQFGCSIFL